MTNNILSDVAKATGFALGAATALIMGKEACTEAVETVIGEHYDECALVFFSFIRGVLRSTNPAN
jgi:demethoxyubiquinone hydroxylase (CLK1/Coq7/Cat5 family)